MNQFDSFAHITEVNFHNREITQGQMLESQVCTSANYEI